jgi:hypothetical protein
MMMLFPALLLLLLSALLLLLLLLLPSGMPAAWEGTHHHWERCTTAAFPVIQAGY